MGLLSEGTPLEWEETKKHSDLVKCLGAEQFLNIYSKFKNRRGDLFKWGDEIEFSLVKFDHENQRAHLLLDADRVLNELNTEKNYETVKFHPEYANYMVEAIPGRPFNFSMKDFLKVEANMKLRRALINKKLKNSDEYCMSITNFPRLGCSNFTWPIYQADPISNKTTHSLFFPEQAIYTGHPRFKTIAKNVRLRRQSKPAIYVPVFKDKFTPRPFRDGESDEFKDDFIYMDATGFGMGCSCVQMTFQCECIDEARFLYDNLAPVCPVLLALSGASPIWRGFLSDVDCRWNVISSSVDDRTKEELDAKINKSRYDSIDSYLSAPAQKYNDIDLVKDEKIYEKLCRSGVDGPIAQHVAHLFIRDPLVLFREKLTTATEFDTDHFENIQSTNWQTMRFKPPPPSAQLCDQIGWRVEFRPTELQLTDFENSAFCVFVALLARAVIKLKLNFLMPISKVDVNMQRAQKRDACRTEKFFFRRNIFSGDECDLVELSVGEIVNGSEKMQFPGLINLIKEFLIEEFQLDINNNNESGKIIKYLRLIEMRANGELLTLASWMRKFVQEHTAYKQDSVVNEKINYDLLFTMNQIANDQIKSPDLIDPSLLS